MAGGDGTEELGSVYKYVKSLRSSMATEELTTRKTRLAKIVEEAKELEAAFPNLPPRPAPKPRKVRRPIRRPPFAVLVGAGVVVIVVALGGLFASGVISLGRGSGGATVVPGFSTVEFLPRMVSRPAAQQGETFYNRDLDFNYSGGTVILSGEPPPQGEFWVDDAISISVRRPDGSTAAWRQDFNAGCFKNQPLPPQDVTHLFLPGSNVVSITLFDVCGANVGTSGPITLSTPQR